MSASDPKKPKLNEVDHQNQNDIMEVELETSNPDEIEAQAIAELEREVISKPPYQILTIETIFQNMMKIVQQTHEVIQDLPPSTLITLLNHVKWDKDKLFDAFFEDSDKLLSDAKVILPPEIKETTTPQEDNFECQICLQVSSSEESTGMNCGHRFCNKCWTDYLQSQIMYEGSSQNIKCPAHGCPIFVEHEMVKAIVKDTTILQKYHSLLMRNYVESNRQLRWCPGAGCGNAAYMECPKWSGVNCTCGNSFCFLCGHDWHEPIKCDILVKWLKKCSDDSETATWMQANTKDCPKCKTMIEKNGGCNHMTCRTASCRHEFCWICMQDWKTHTGDAYNCNRFDEAKNNNASNARASLNRYLHYYQRYLTHQQSLKFETKLKDTVTEKMSRFQAKGTLSWVDVQFLPRAAETLCRCRKTLMYTYGFAFFLVKNNQSEIFEDNQRDLESATEILSGFLEHDEDETEDPYQHKVKVIDSYSYCESRRRQLIAHVQEGYEVDNENTWQYRC